MLIQASAGPRDTAAEGSSDGGLTLVEVMVAMVLFAVGSLALLSVLMSGMSSTFDNRARVTAANLAAADIDEARSLDYYSLTSVAPKEKFVGGRTYWVSRDVVVTMASGASTSSCVGSGSAKQLHKRVSTRVETTFRSPSTKSARADTLVKAPLFDPSSPTGAIALAVIDRQGKALSGLGASVPSASRTTDSNGCAFFDGLPAGDHVVTVVRSGSVTRQGSTSLTRTVNVTPGQIAPSVLRIDTAVSLKAMSNVFDGTTAVTGFSLPNGLAARVSAPERGIPTKIDYAAQTLTAGADVAWTAYPDPGGYDAYTGPCSPVVHLDAEPGTSPRAVLPLSPVTVWLQGKNSADNTRTRSKSPTAEWSVSGCAESLGWPVSTSSSCEASSNGSDACIVKVGVPPGSWKFSGGSGCRSTTATVAARTPQTVTLDCSA